jgi:HlyD family secretion protein
MKLSKPLWIAIACAVLAGGGYAVYARMTRAAALPEGLIQANGRIEGDRITVASKLPGRIAELKVREGDAVTAGQVLVLLDSAQVDAKLNQARAAVQALEAQIRAAQTGLGALGKLVPLENASADTGVAQSEAMLQKARAASEQAERDAKRLEELAARGSVAQQRAELARLAAVAANADVAAGTQALARARQMAQEARLGGDKVRAKTDEVAALTAQLGQARAGVAEAEAVRADLTVKAPSAGIVVTRVRNTGEVIGAGSPIVELLDPDRLYLKVYVPEQSLGKLRLDLPAQVYIDGLPEQAFPAKVKFIASRAEFTPKEVQTVDERVKLTYAVQLYLDANPQHRLSAGMPADAVIRWKEDTPWQRPKW